MSELLAAEEVSGNCIHDLIGTEFPIGKAKLCDPAEQCTEKISKFHINILLINFLLISEALSAYFKIKIRL